MDTTFRKVMCYNFWICTNAIQKMLVRMILPMYALAPMAIPHKMKIASQMEWRAAAAAFQGLTWFPISVRKIFALASMAPRILVEKSHFAWCPALLFVKLAISAIT
jgi:hypothetical protein